MKIWKKCQLLKVFQIRFRSYLKLEKNTDVWGPLVSGIVAPRRALVGCRVQPYLDACRAGI
jgi:hypothetical protein